MQGKRVIVCNAQVPFAYGGSEVLTETLVRRLGAAGLDSALVQLPYQWDPPETHLKACRLWEVVDLTRVAAASVDAVICTKFPTYLCDHPNKVVWLFHQFRACTDQYGGPFGLADTPTNRAYRRQILEKDRESLSKARKLFAISKNVAARLKRYVGLTAEVLYPPVQGEHLFKAEGYGPYVMLICRMEPNKRPQLLIEALRHTRSPVRAVLVGTGRLMADLAAMIRQYHLTDRVELKGAVSLPDLVTLYANSLAVAMLPVDEDYGLVTVEAFKARRPVIATSDSGGVLEFVHHGTTGLVTRPDPLHLASALDRLYQDRALCAKLGTKGQDVVSDITWKRTIERLLPYL